MSDFVICDKCGETFKSADTTQDYCPSCRSTSSERTPEHQIALDNAKKARQTASFVGLKALTGSAKQKNWGEVIRKTFIESLNDDRAIHFLTAATFAKAAFWIDNRDSLQQLQDNIKSAINLKEKANALNAQGLAHTEEYHIVAANFHDVIARIQ